MVAGIERNQLLTNRRIEACFRWFDIVRFLKITKNQDGEISVAEFKDTLGASFVKEEDWEIALKDVDTNKNGKIDFSEFMLLFKNLKTQETTPFMNKL